MYLCTYICTSYYICIYKSSWFLSLFIVRIFDNRVHCLIRQSNDLTRPTTLRGSLSNRAKCVHNRVTHMWLSLLLLTVKARIYCRSGDCLYVKKCALSSLFVSKISTFGYKPRTFRSQTMLSLCSLICSLVTVRPHVKSNRWL